MTANSHDWNGFHGTAKRLEDIDIPRIGHRIGVGEDELHALMEVEAAGSGFDSRNRPKMLFEPHVFYRNLRGQDRARAVEAGLAYRSWGEQPYPRDSYPRLLSAIEIDETAALKSASWGRGQILGENYSMVGYESVQAMVLAFMADEENHLEAMVQFVIASGIDDDLRAHRWEVVARVYNGPGYARHGYHTRLAAAYRKWQRIPDTAWSPEDDDTAAPGSIPRTYRDGRAYEAVRAVQERLDALGYPEVGSFDGKWGSKTRAAVLAFRADVGLPLLAEIDEALLAALMTAEPRQVSETRAAATVSDLRREGAADVRAADVAQTAGGVAVAGGVVAEIGSALDQAESYGGIARRVVEVVEPIKGLVTENLPLILVGIGIVVLWQTGVLKRIRLFKHQTGQDVSE